MNYEENVQIGKGTMEGGGRRKEGTEKKKRDNRRKNGNKTHLNTEGQRG